MQEELQRFRNAEAARVTRDAEEAAVARARRHQQKENEQRALARETQAGLFIDYWDSDMAMEATEHQARFEKVGATTPSKSRGREKVKVQPALRNIASHSGRVIRCSDDLSANEKHHLLDEMLVALDNRDNHASIDPAATARVTDERREEALAYLFEGGWNTTQPYASPPHKSQLNKTSDATSIAFGVIDKQDLTMENRWRSAGKTCYIHVKHNREKDEITFDYKDDEGSFVSWRDVRMGEGWTNSYAKKQACQNFDREHDHKVHAYNCRLFKSTGQRRLQEYAGKGDANRANPQFNKSLDAKTLQFGKTYPTLPILANQLRELQETYDGMARDGPHPKITRFI